MSKPPVAEQVQVNFRMPVALRDRIKAAADKSGRSMNAEIVAALEVRYPPPKVPGEILLLLFTQLAEAGLKMNRQCKVGPIEEYTLEFSPEHGPADGRITVKHKGAVVLDQDFVGGFVISPTDGLVSISSEEALHGERKKTSSDGSSIVLSDDE